MQSNSGLNRFKGYVMCVYQTHLLLLLLFINLLIHVYLFFLAGFLEGKSDPLDETLLEETFEETMSASEVRIICIVSCCVNSYVHHFGCGPPLYYFNIKTG